MKIFFVGVLDIPWSTNVEMKKALLALGHEVDDFNYRSEEAEHIPTWQKNAFFEVFADKMFSFLRRFDVLPDSLHNIYYGIRGRKQMNQRLLEKVKSSDYDLVIFLKTDTINPVVIAKISKMVNTWYYFMDPEHIAMKINLKNYIQAATWASSSSRHIVKNLKSDGYTNVSFLPQGYAPGLWSTGRNQDKEIDVLFVGSINKKRLSFIRAIRDAGIDVRCHGQGWENPPIYQEQLVELYKRSKIALNFPRDNAFSVRVYQVMATGTFMLSLHSCGLEVEFEKEKHLDWFKNFEELIEKLTNYLSNEVLRERIAMQGKRYVGEHYQWSMIMKQITDKVI